MSAVFQSVTDPTRGHNLVSTRADNLETIRYVVFMGDVLDPDRKYQSEHLRYSAGGEEVQAHCLRRSIGGFIEKCRLTPMEVWTEAMPPVLIGEGAERDTVRITGPTTPETLGATRRPGGLAGVGASLAHVKFYPGDEILAVLRAHEGKGITEVKALAGQTWYADDLETEPGLAQLLNADFFPTVPVELSKVREMIDKKAGASEIHSAVSKDLIAACNQFERWAMARLSAEHTLLRQRTSPNGQHTYTYTPVARELLRQLEMQPQDSLMEQAAGITAEQLQAIIAGAGGGGMNADMIGQIVGAVTNQILAAQKANEEPAKKAKGRKDNAVDATEPDVSGSEN